MDITHAKVRFIEDNFKVTVPITKIVEFQSQPPKSIVDFDKQKVYACLWKDEKNPEVVSLGVQIAELAIINNDDELKAFDKKRANLPALHASAIEEFNNALDEETKTDHKKLKKKQKDIEKQVIAAEGKVHRDILLNKIKNFTSTTDLKENPKTLDCSFNDNGNVEAFDANINNECCQKIFKKYELELEKNQTLMKKNKKLEETIDTLRCLNDYLQKELFINQKCKLSRIDTNLTGEPIIDDEKPSCSYDTVHIDEVFQKNDKLPSPTYNKSPRLQISTSKSTSTPNNTPVSRHAFTLRNTNTPHNTPTSGRKLLTRSKLTPMKFELEQKEIDDMSPLSKILTSTPTDKTQKNLKSCRKRIIDAPEKFDESDSKNDLVTDDNDSGVNLINENKKRPKLMGTVDVKQTKKNVDKEVLQENEENKGENKHKFGDKWIKRQDNKKKTVYGKTLKLKRNRVFLRKDFFVNCTIMMLRLSLADRFLGIRT